MPISSDALAVVMGIIFGVAASIPTSLLIVAATKQDRRETYRRPTAPAPPEPIDAEYRLVDSWGMDLAEFEPGGRPPRIIGGYPE